MCTYERWCALCSPPIDAPRSWRAPWRGLLLWRPSPPYGAFGPAAAPGTPAGNGGTVVKRSCERWAHPFVRMSCQVQTSSHGACCPSTFAVLFSRSVFSQAGRPARGKLLGVELPPMVLLASQELAARAATRDQHLYPGAQPFVPETTSKTWVLTRQRPLKNRF